MHTASVVNFLYSDTVEERSGEYPDPYYDKNFILLLTRMMKNLEYINILIVEKPNKRTHQR